MGHSYRDLIVWQRAMSVAHEVYQITKKFPKEEQYILVSQMRRSAISVASNVAEGQGRLNQAEFRQFLGLARGSLLELETQAELATRLDYLPHDQQEVLLQRTAEVLRMLNALISKLET